MTRRVFFAAVFTLAALVALCAPRPGLAQAPSADVVARLASFDPAQGDLSAMLIAATPGLSRHFLRLTTTAIHKGGPLTEALGPPGMARLSDDPGDLPLVIYRKEDGRLPGAFIVARYKGVLPVQILMRIGQRAPIVKHPLVAQYQLLSTPTDASAAGWGPGAARKVARALYLVDMPFGAGMFGLRPCHVFGDWEWVTWPNGVAVASFALTGPTPAESARLKVLKDKDGDEQTLDDDYFPAREYRLTSLLLPERGPPAQPGAGLGPVRHTVHLYFVRIVPALDEGTDLKDSGAFARWLFARGAKDAVIQPIAMFRRAMGQ